MYPEMVGLFTMIRNSQTQHKHHVRTTGYIDLIMYLMGGDLEENWGDSPPNFEVGGLPMHPSPNIWRSNVKGWAGKYKVTKNGEMKDFLL